MESYKARAKYLLQKCNGDAEFAKKITFNNAKIASYEGNNERLDAEASIYHYIKENEKKTNGFSK